jgi:crossover junction endodeoxyribonuclease RuvC
MPNSQSSFLLGFDPGLTRCGFGLVEKSGSRQVTFRDVGVFVSSKELDQSTRIAQIGDEISNLLDRVKPAEIAIERLFAQQNLQSVMGVAQISGVIVYLAHLRGIPVTFFTPTEVKAAVTGSGRANKTQVTTMMTKILKLKEVPKPADAADALAVAVTLAWRGGKSASVNPSTETKAQEKWRNAISETKKTR